MKTQKAFFVDVQRCIGCYTCAMACKNIYAVDSGIAWRNLQPVKDDVYPHRDMAFYSLACNHCEQPACAEACPEEAIYKRDQDGAVVIDPDKCTGEKNCITACPYGVPKFNNKTGQAEKCHLCHTRLDAGKQPGCVESCPTGALTLMSLAKIKDKAVAFPPGFKKTSIGPSIRFRLAKVPRIVRRDS